MARTVKAMAKRSELNRCGERHISSAACDRLPGDPVTVARMPLKHAVLALIAERRGYGYDLVQRFEERVGPGWQLNASAVYPALDQLERGGLATSAVQRGGTRRSPRVVYAPTDAGRAVLDTWLGTTDAPPEPVRSDLHLRLAFAGEQHRDALATQLSAHEQACARLLARYPRPAPADRQLVALVDDAVTTRLSAELTWLRRAREAIVGDT
jgi:DNA-binding PadR family transcriptional regulator